MAEITGITNPALRQELGSLEEMYYPPDEIVSKVLDSYRESWPRHRVPDRSHQSKSDYSILREYAYNVHRHFISGIARGAKNLRWSEEEGNAAIQLGAAQSREFLDNLQSINYVSKPKITRRPQPQSVRDIDVGPHQHPDGPHYY